MHYGEVVKTRFQVIKIFEKLSVFQILGDMVVKIAIQTVGGVVTR